MPPLDLTPLSNPIRVPVGAATLVAEVTGQGPTVVCLHAGVADRRSWRAVGGLLAADHRVVAYDRRGFGDTEAPPEEHDHVADLVAVCDTLEVERAVIVGNSMGGGLALDLAQAHPERVAGLVLLGSAWPGGPQEDDPDDVEALFATAVAAFDAGDLDEVNRIECHFWLDGPRSPEGRVTGAARELFLDMNRRVLDLEDTVGTAVEQPPTWDRLGAITVPVTVVEGALDHPTALPRARTAADRFPIGRFELLEGVAHLPPLEVPDRVAAIVRDVVTGSDLA